MQTLEVQHMPVSKDSHPQSIKSKSQSTSPQTQINGRTIRRGTLKKGTKILIHLPAAEISGNHQTYAVLRLAAVQAKNMEAFNFLRGKLRQIAIGAKVKFARSAS